MATITAQNILDYNHYTTANCSTENTEAITDIIIGYINNEANASIPLFRDQAGVAGSRTITVTDTQHPLVIFGAGLMLRAYKDKGPNITVSSTGVSTIIQDPQFQLFKAFLDSSINRLRGRSFLRT